MTSRETFKTDRLVADVWSKLPEDAAHRQQFLEELGGLLTPAVLRLLPDSLQLEEGDHALENWIVARIGESRVMTVRGKEQGNLLGLIILAEFERPEQPSMIHLGYLFAQTAWGFGYATEIINGLITFYRQQGRPVQLLAGLENTNKASARVLEKSGFERLEEQSDDQQSMYRLSI